MRSFISSIFAPMFLLGLVSGCVSEERELHLFTWNDYIRPDLIEKFKERHHCQVTVDLYDSNELMYTKLSLSQGNYDLVFPSSYFMEMMVKQDMLESLEFSKLPNVQHLDPDYMSLLPANIKDFGLPYAISLAGIGYRKDKVGDFTPSWAVFGNSHYAGKMTMLSESREVLGAALKFLGYSANSVDPQEIDAAVTIAIGWKGNLAKFEAELYKAGLANGEYYIAQGYDGDVQQVIRENPSVAFAYPIEGTISSMDLMAIPKGAKNQELAYAFINFLLEGEVAADNMASTLFFMPNKAAYKLLPDHLRNNPIFKSAREALATSELIRDLGEQVAIYEKAWDRVKAE